MVLLQVKLCDPCLSALKWFVYHARRYTSARLYFTYFTVLLYRNCLTSSVRSVNQRPSSSKIQYSSIHSTLKTMRKGGVLKWKCGVNCNRAFPVAAARAWNSLPPSVRSTSSLASFCLHLKTHLFAASFQRHLELNFVQCPCNSFCDSVT